MSDQSCSSSSTKEKRKKWRCRWAPLEKPWGQVLAVFGRFVARYPYPFIIVPVLLTLTLSTGILTNFKIVRGVHYLYAPQNARWKWEEETFHRLWANSDDHFYPGKDVLRRKGLYLIVEAKDRGNVLRKEYADEFLRLLDWMSHETFYTPDGENYTYADICLHFQNDCFSNAHARLIAKIFSEGDNDKMNVSYPSFATKYSVEPIDLSQTIGNVTVDENGQVKSATAWMILFQLKQYSPRMLRLSSLYEITIEKHIRMGTTPTSLVDIYHFHSETFENELADGNKRIIPRFGLTFGLLILFSVVCTFNIKSAWRDNRERVVVDWTLSKLWTGVSGVVTTLMAIVSAMGILLLFDVTFVDMCTVMPFLSLTVGIDDMFLMLAAWHDSNRMDTVEKRIEYVVRQAGVSISITSLTDSLAFFIGAIAPLPAVTYFCFYSAVAIIFIFVYTMTIFLAILSLQGRLEERNCNSVTGRVTKDIAIAEKCSTFDFYFNMGSRPDGYRSYHPSIVSLPSSITGILKHSPSITTSSSSKSEVDDRLWYQKFFEDYYAPFICQPVIQLLALGLFVTYVIVAVWGVQKLVVGFDLINIVQKDSPAWKFIEIRNKLFPENLAHLDVAILSPPNMADAESREKFLNFLDEFEATRCSLGRNSTDLWFFAYEKYIDNLGFGSMWEEIINDEELFYENLRGFLMSNDKYAYDVIQSDNGTITTFRFATSLKNFGTDYNIVTCANTIRSLTDRYPEYNITSYTPLWNLADQFEIMWPQTMQDLYISVGVMVPIAVMFIPQPLCSVMIGLNIASIAFGVLGYMSWWGINLDATSMITIAMSVGFSVDFAAHVTYGYMADAKTRIGSHGSPRQRLVATLGTVGWPVSQASFSVFLGISTLATVDNYVVQTCFKTVFLVVLFGSLHALVFLPLVLMQCHNLYLLMFSCNDRREDPPVQVTSPPMISPPPFYLSSPVYPKAIPSDHAVSRL